MVKNGQAKLCDKCQTNYSMSHRYHGKYMCFLCSGIKTEEELLEKESLARKSQLITQLLHEYGHRKDLICQDLIIHDDKYMYIFWECGRKDGSNLNDYRPGWSILTWDRSDFTEEHILFKKYDKKDKSAQIDNLAIINSLDWVKDREKYLEKEAES